MPSALGKLVVAGEAYRSARRAAVGKPRESQEQWDLNGTRNTVLEAARDRAAAEEFAELLSIRAEAQRIDRECCHVSQEVETLIARILTVLPEAP